ncbi:MAG: XRE family transcriptional regulator, partial [Proteobacteria bacterium]|nr:XRE family transcriptional regulator [Pseudomonadota bacterium]
VGKALRYWRRERGLSLQEVAATVGVSYQMLQKYESAQCRVSAGRLSDLAKALQVEVPVLLEHNPKLP